MRTAIRSAVIVAAVLGLAGCGNLPLHYDLKQEEAKVFVSKETLKTIKNDGLTVPQVKSLLGEPNAAIVDGPQALGYVHCVRWTGECIGVVFFIPIIPKFPCSQDACQYAGVWFDDQGRAVDTKTEEWDERLRDDCALDVWLKNHGSTRRCYR